MGPKSTEKSFGREIIPCFFYALLNQLPPSGLREETAEIQTINQHTFMEQLSAERISTRFRGQLFFLRQPSTNRSARTLLLIITALIVQNVTAQVFQDFKTGEYTKREETVTNRW